MEIELKDVQKSFEGLNTAFKEFKDTNDERLKQIEEKGAADPMLDEKLGKMQTAMDANQKSLEDFQLAEKRKSRFTTDAKGQEIDLDLKAQNWADNSAKRQGAVPADFNAERMSEYSKAYDTMLRKGKDELTQDERKALSVGSDPDGGFFVSPDMTGRIVTEVFETSPMRQYASQQTISTDSLKGIWDDDESTVFWEGETETPQEGATPQVGDWTIAVHEMRTIQKATQKLIEDSSINIESWLAEKVSAKMGRAENAAFVTGSGVGRPRGFLDYVEGTDLRNSIEQFDTAANGAFAAAPNGGDVLIDALYGLKAPYRANANWFMNRGTTKAVRKLKDSDGAYIWQPSIAAGQPATLLGYGTAAFEDMPDIATGSLSIAVGDMRQAYQIVDRTGVSILRDPFSYKPYVGFYFRKRVGGGMINGEALKIINFKA